MPAWTAEELDDWKRKGARMDAIEVKRWGQADVDAVVRKAQFDQMRRFLMALFAPYRGKGFIELRAISPTAPAHIHWIPCSHVGYVDIDGVRHRAENRETLQKAFEWAQMSSKQGREVYAGVLPRSEKSGKKNAIFAAQWAWADVDFKLGDVTVFEREDFWLDKMANLSEKYAPDMSVLSGNGLHLYWRIGRLKQFRTTADIRGFERSLKTFQQSVQPGSDSTQDLTRILRLPGTYNRKNPQDVKNVTLSWASPEPEVGTYVPYLNTEAEVKK